MRTQEDNYEEEVRRRYADMLASAGVDSGRMNLEVLYLLPPEFVRMYVELFDRALNTSPTSAGPMGKDEGKVKKMARRQGVGAREMQVGKASKRHKTHWTLRSERAMDAKKRLDRRLVRAAEKALQDARQRPEGAGRFIRAADFSTQVVPDDTQAVRSDGGSGEKQAQQGLRTEQSAADSRGRQCADCGQFLSPRWVRCPFHG